MIPETIPLMVNPGKYGPAGFTIHASTSPKAPVNAPATGPNAAADHASGTNVKLILISLVK